MSVRKFLTILFAAVLGVTGLWVGILIHNAVAHATAGARISPLLQHIKDVSDSFPIYPQVLMVCLGALGVCVGVILGPKAANALENAGDTLEQMPARDKVAIGLGSFVGLFISLVFAPFLLRVPYGIGIPLFIAVTVASFYLGIRGALGMKDEFAFLRPAPEVEADASPGPNVKILDTNVIIDGRIADICRTGFLEGTLYVPGFVLEELQHIADSSDDLKRARGRRGLDILNSMQKDLPLVVRSWDKLLDRASQHDPVDTRLVKLAKALDATIVTNDFNLNKVAALQGVPVLNVNELANAIKPVVLPGEKMRVCIVKEGKEPDQGVAYLDDGTMIVVEDGRNSIGSTVDVIVTSIWQTAAGKMIFARIQTSEDNENGDSGESTSPTQSSHSTGYTARRGDNTGRRTGKKVYER
ncbi:MAG TPA: PIN domain-containing protein [Chthonomonas sp.]|uniref:PIN/TRAM domain-containing protein n=1 Tax=Chthonomonas sp. TaxID=2282153 RepID=UPI002B4B20F0|nr:PIN domain-containing protein [Chthonomonas sp.]HLI48351.1 PIN domain-containing protein [Chthonomonas sp.]